MMNIIKFVMNFKYLKCRKEYINLIYLYTIYKYYKISLNILMCFVRYYYTKKIKTN
jgi:hypothetical protein